ncbi:AEC family transporter [Rhodoblastus sp. 17X3]|uniref:AEC family transporter n=1 Tax=Rhodoblastus sp. 17X3 TaxID=3047026 RepID=UPI0024B79B0C|nr:AEC family transporter [Rhodoblastus sp. 17X3]MDI9850001.1 AEC family transporter [Rhodoblastus sp. 17X3]
MLGAVLMALAPIALLIGLGSWLRRHGLLAETFWPQAERLGYYVLLPSLFFDGLATAQLGGAPIRDLAATLIVSTLAVAALIVVCRPLMPLSGPAFTSVFQGGVRFNNYVGVTLAAGLFGAQGVALAAVCNAAIVPTVNVLCVLVFARHGETQLEARAILRQILINPLVVACSGGIALQTLGLRLPAALEPALKALGAASLPLGLMCVGAALDFSATRRWMGPVVLSSAAKFMAMPIATIATANALGLHGPAFTTALLFQALPTASSAYILARQLGGDAPLMAGITASQTVIGFTALPAVLAAALPA